MTLTSCLVIQSIPCGKIFTKCLSSVLDYKIIDDSLVEIFYQALDDNCKVVFDTITYGTFLDCQFSFVAKQLVKVAKTIRAWGSRDKSTTKSSFSISTDSEQAI